MSSSRYTAYFAMSNDAHGEDLGQIAHILPLITEKRCIWARCASVNPGNFLEDFKKLRDKTLEKNKEFLIITAGQDEHSCREGLLGSLAEVLRSFKNTATNSFSYATVYVYYNKESGRSLPEDWLNRIKWFGETFLNEWMGLFSIDIVDGEAILSYKVQKITVYRDLWTISLFLWIFRNKNILFRIMEDFNGKLGIGLAALYQYLSQRFLMYDDWGSGSVSNVCMSLYCYVMTTTKEFPSHNETMFLGPSQAAGNITPISTILDYIELVYLPTVQTYPASMNSLLIGSPEEFRASFKRLVYLLKSQKELEELLEKKEE